MTHTHTRTNTMLRERRPSVPEEHVVRMWLESARPEKTFLTTAGETVRILHPGVRNRHDGPDFLQATVVLGGVLRKGDIEIHVRERDWERHGHHNDEHYRDVVLHVCLYAEYRKASALSTVILAMQLGETLRDAWTRARRPAAELRCAAHGARPRRDRAEAALELAAAERFARKRERVRTRMSELLLVLDRGSAFRQVVYEGIARGMGFGGNEERFTLLAQALPLSALSCLPAKERLQRLVAASDSEPSSQAPAWWNRSGIMPHNRHERRLRWMADWCSQLDDPRWWRRCFRLLKTRPRMSSGLHSLFSVGHPARHPGKERVHELLVNVLAPAVAEYAAAEVNDDLASSAVSLYFHLSSPPENRRTRIVGSALQLASETSGRQQGMVELHAEHCSLHRCRECLLSLRQGPVSGAGL